MDLADFTGRSGSLRQLDELLAAGSEQPVAVILSAIAGAAGSARPRWRCTGRTGWRVDSRTGSCS
jgi:hypothetical protein